jgi:DeoR family transcriptional regulator of aga operon
MKTRHARIIDLLKQEQQVNVRDLARRLDVSEMTIRRDMVHLERQGFLVRTHGGGMTTGKISFLQDGMLSDSISPEKQAIGRVAASLVSPNDTIMLDAGTTALQVALHLPRIEGVMVATTSLCVAQALYGSPLQVLLLGGYLRKEFPSLYGPLTERMLDGFHVDTLFTGCDAANSREGLYTADLHLSSLEQMMIRIADRVVVVAESSKFDKRAFVRFATLDQVHTIVTDPGISEQDKQNFEEQGITVLVAGQE